MHVPGHGRVVRIAGVVILRVSHAVAIGIAQVEVERVGDAVTAGAAFDQIGFAQRAELVADGQNIVLFMGGEGDVVHARPGAAGHRGIVHRRLAAHPGGVNHAVFIADVFRYAEAQPWMYSTARGTSGVIWLKWSRRTSAPGVYRS